MATKIISGSFGGPGTPAVGSWDAMHSFSTRSSDGFGGKVHAAGGWAGGAVSKALQNFYKTENLNPCITAIKITVDPKSWTTSWEVTIEESPDGKAYVGFNSWGGASGGYPAKKLPASHAYSNYLKEVKNVLNQYPGADPRNVLDFYFPGGFRQIFFQYTIPKKYPDLKKSPNAKTGSVGVTVGPSGSPAGLPEYNGVLFSCVTIKEDPAGPSASNPNAATGPSASGPSASNPDNGSPSITSAPTDPTKITGKFTLKVKSGPGVMIGITEVDIVEGKADFSGIQFDEPGDYVISVASTSPDIDSNATEIKLKVNPAPEVIPQDPKGNTASEATGDRPIIAQIDYPTLPLESMMFPDRDTPTDGVYQVAQTIGNLPLFNFGGSVINDRDIQQLKLYHEGIIPKVKITFRDSNNLLSENPPQDDSKFEIFISSKSPNLKSIHLKFKIEDFQKLQNNAYSVTGAIDISELYRMKFKVYRGTSFEAIRQICKDLKIGFNSNIQNTADEMPWRNIGDRSYKFIGEIIKHSYISDESFMAGYIDFYYCFNYVDVEKEMKRSIISDMGIETGTLSGKQDSEKMARLQLNSDKGLNSSCFYFIKQAQKNESTKISMQQGYKTRTKFYDKVKKMFLVFDVDSTTSDEKSTIIMKGASGDQEAFDNNFVTKYAGKIDTDNVHKNYNYAVTQNRINLDNMMKNQMDIRMPNPNFNIYKYQKVDVMLVKELATVASAETVEWRYSGEWLISEIVYEVSGGKLYQDVKLVRKELGKNPEEMNNPEKAPVKPEAKDPKNENPIVGTASETIVNKPNNAYKVDEVYTVQDANGKRYILTIKKLSENGIEVVADVKDIDYVPKTNEDTIKGVTQSSEPIGPTGPSASGATYSGTYPFDVNLERYMQYGGNEGDFYQELVTDHTKNHPFFSQNGAWQQNTFVGDGTGTLKNEETTLNEWKIKSVFIAIKRPLPTYKPEGSQKSNTPYNWALFELKDEGIQDHDMSGVSGGDLFPNIYNGLKYRMLHGIECYKGSFPDKSGKDERWSVPKGYIKIMDESGSTVIESAYTDTQTLKAGAKSINEETGDYMVKGGFAGTPPVYKYNSWFKYPGNGSSVASVEVESDQQFTPVGKRNTIYYDMSDANKYKPGVYTIEIKYYVPVYEKDERTRIMVKDSEGYNAYEAKVLKSTFEIVKKSKKK